MLRFIKAFSKIKLPRRWFLLPWDLPLLLRVLGQDLFKPLDSISLQRLINKTVTLVALASGRRVSELQALSFDQPYLVFQKDRVILRTLLEFQPKVVLQFHLSQDIVPLELS